MRDLFADVGVKELLDGEMAALERERSLRTVLVVGTVGAVFSKFGKSVADAMTMALYLKGDIEDLPEELDDASRRDILRAFEFCVASAIVQLKGVVKNIGREADYPELDVFISRYRGKYHSTK